MLVVVARVGGRDGGRKGEENGTSFGSVALMLMCGYLAKLMEERKLRLTCNMLLQEERVKEESRNRISHFVRMTFIKINEIIRCYVIYCTYMYA